jgi:anti-sigma regulatory factor (Ser/Thr protein kinase)
LSARAFPGTLDAAVQAEAWAAEQCERLALAADASFALSLCLEELFVNAVRHGGAQEIRLALTRDGLEFRDDGAAFDPTQAPGKRLEGPSPDFEIGGFGVGLLQKFADRLGYERAGGWNVVRLALPGAGS